METGAKMSLAEEIIEDIDGWRHEYGRWLSGGQDTEDIRHYSWVVNRTAPFVPARRAISMTNVALISSAGAYIDGANPLAELEFREIPREVEAEDLLYAGHGYDSAAVRQDRNVLVPVERLWEYRENGVIGDLNAVWWSFNGYITDAGKLAEALPALVERVTRFDARAALLIPASRLCHQSCGLVARALEASGIPTMMLAVERAIPDKVRPPRTAYYDGEIGQTVGPPNWPEKQRRILDEALRLIEPIDQPTVHKLVVQLQTEVEQERGEK
jgi:D-proline reductase (dithiol) PrdB